jgi:glycolate oxidase iron-sulfur subunit
VVEPRVSDSRALPSSVYDGTLDCVHCGLCLTSCPTYLETGRETSSPRGRIYLMRGVAEGKVAGGALLEEEAYLCLGCRACETACPSGVEYGAMLELARESITASGRRNHLAARLERFALREIVPRPARLKALVGLLALAQRLGLDRLALPLLPRALRDSHALLPQIPSAADRRPLPAFTPAQGEPRGRVAFFEGCVMPQMFGAVNRATVQVLAQNGFDVLVPGDQGCCGALQAHTGDLPTARELASRNAAAFDASDVDALIVNSAGCGAAMREAPHWIGEAGRAYAGRVRDIAEFLDDVGFRPPDPAVASGSSEFATAVGDQNRKLRVCYDDPCHLVHGQGVAAAPRRLLAQVPGLELIQHADASACCGAAGIYNLTHREMSQAVLARKLDALEAARPDVIASGNPGCLMQLAAGARERGIAARVVHPVELLVARS